MIVIGADVVVDVSNSPSFDDQAALDFFRTAGKNLTAAEVAADVKHHVALSVVGTDRALDSGYFRAKLVHDPGSIGLDSARTDDVPNNSYTRRVELPVVHYRRSDRSDSGRNHLNYHWLPER